ncbi:MAG: phosphonoacetaldehyde hydrolase [Desulfuromonadales bacterium]
MDTYTYRRTYTGPLKAVILDWDGTIVDHGSCASAQTITELFRRHGVQVGISQIRTTMGVSQRAQLEEITDMDQVALQWEQIYGLYPTQRDIYNLNRELIALQSASLGDYKKPITGALEAIRVLRDMRMLIGTTTNHTTEMLRILASEAVRCGFEPDAGICTDHVSSARPHPWMCFKAALEMQTYPMEAIVKVGDTLPDIEEGLNAGMWTIAIAGTGNEVGLDESELELLSEKERNARIIRARERLSRGGAHYVVDSLADVPQIVEEINRRLADGDRA